MFQHFQQEPLSAISARGIIHSRKCQLISMTKHKRKENVSAISAGTHFQCLVYFLAHITHDGKKRDGNVIGGDSYGFFMSMI